MSDVLSPGPLPNLALLALWEDGSRQGPADRALTMLRHALPGEDPGALAHWPIGRRDAGLLSLHAALFGSRIDALVICPHCQEQLDLAIEVDDLRTSYGDAGAHYSMEMPGEPYQVTFRLPTSADLRAVLSGTRSLSMVERALAERCIVTASYDGALLAATLIPEAVIAQIGDAMGVHDAQADIQLDVTCPACGERWEETFDIVDFLWREITARARRLVREVHSLALAYGWREEDILALSETRRQLYLELVR
jgi:hypothetical protein